MKHLPIESIAISNETVASAQTGNTENNKSFNPCLCYQHSSGLTSYRGSYCMAHAERITKTKCQRRTGVMSNKHQQIQTRHTNTNYVSYCRTRTNRYMYIHTRNTETNYGKLSTCATSTTHDNNTNRAAVMDHDNPAPQKTKLPVHNSSLSRYFPLFLFISSPVPLSIYLLSSLPLPLSLSHTPACQSTLAPQGPA